MRRELMPGIRLLGHESMRRQLRNSFGELLRHWSAPGSLLASVLLGASIATALNFDKPSLISEITMPTWPVSTTDCETALTPSRRQRISSDLDQMLANSSTALPSVYKLSMSLPGKSETFILGRCHHGTKPHQHRLNLEESR